MRLIRHLQHWLGGSGPHLQVADFAPKTHSIRQWTEWLAIQTAGAMDEGLVSPAHLLIDTFPAEQGSQRVIDATTLYKAQKKSSNSSRTS
jgi:hypothetical protein